MKESDFEQLSLILHLGCYQNSKGVMSQVWMTNSFDLAYKLFYESSGPMDVLCVKPPRCKWVSNCSDAHLFFKTLP